MENQKMSPQEDEDEEDVPAMLDRLVELKERNRAHVNEIEQLESSFSQLAAKKNLSVVDLLREYSMDLSFDDDSSSRRSLTSTGSKSVDAADAATTGAGVSPKQRRKSMIQKATSRLFPYPKAQRRALQPEVRTTLREFFDEQVSKRVLEQQNQEFRTQLEALQQEKLELETKLDASDHVSTELSDLVDSHASEMQKILSVCEQQKDRIDELQRDKQVLKAANDGLTLETKTRLASLQEKKIRLEQNKEEINLLKRDRKNLRKKLKQVEEQMPKERRSSSKTKPQPLLELETLELLEDFREQDQEAAKLLAVVGVDVAKAEALKILSNSHTADADSMHQKLNNDVTKMAGKTVRDDNTSPTSDDSSNHSSVELDLIKQDKQRLELSLKDSQQENTKLRKSLEKQQAICTQQKEELDSLRTNFQQTLDEKMQEHKQTLGKLQNAVKESSSNVEHYKFMFKEHSVLLKSLQDGQLDQMKAAQAEDLTKEVISQQKQSTLPQSDVSQKLESTKSEIESNEELKHKLVIVEQIVQETQAELEQVKDINHVLQQKLVQMEENASKYKTTSEEIAAQSEKEQESNKGLKEKLISMEQNANKQKECLAETNTELEQTKTELKNTIAGNKQLKQSINSLQQDAAKMQMYKESLDETKAELGKMKEINENLQQKFASLEQVEKKMKETRINLSSTIKELKDELQLHKTENEFLKQANELLSSKLKAAREAAVMSEKAKKRQSVKEKEHKEEMKHHESLIKTLRLSKEGLEWEREYQKTEIKKLKSAKEKLVEDLRVARLTAAALQEEALSVEEYITDLATLRENEKKAFAELEKLRHTVRSQASEIGMFKTTCEGYEERISFWEKHPEREDITADVSFDDDDDDDDDYASANSNAAELSSEDEAGVTANRLSSDREEKVEKIATQPLVAKSCSLATGTICLINSKKTKSDESTTHAVGGNNDRPPMLNVIDVHSLGRGVLHTLGSEPNEEKNISDRLNKVRK